MDLYVLLGVAEKASDADIKRAYRRLARRYHPDINPGDDTAAVRFRQILEAYETLVDPDRRHQYDAGGSPALSGERKSSGFEGFDFSSKGADYGGTFGELFAEVLTDRHGTPSSRGADLHATLSLTFDEALWGAERPVTVTRRDTCRGCSGLGAEPQSSGGCQACQGQGAVRSVRGHMVFARNCPVCEGSGQRLSLTCDVCAGSGQETRAENAMVRVPAGVSDGEDVRVPSKGHAGVRGGESGDLYITVQVADHPVYRREGSDLHTVVPVAVHEAALGTRVEVETPDGPTRLRVPPGTQSGQRFRLRGRGVPSARQGTRGDLIVEMRLMLPGVLDERSKELLREFGRINGESVRGGHRGGA